MPLEPSSGHARWLEPHRSYYEYRSQISKYPAAEWHTDDTWMRKRTLICQSMQSLKYAPGLRSGSLHHLKELEKEARRNVRSFGSQVALRPIFRRAAEPKYPVSGSHWRTTDKLTPLPRLLLTASPELGELCRYFSPHVGSTATPRLTLHVLAMAPRAAANFLSHSVQL